jgi:hypothetical protein
MTLDFVPFEDIDKNKWNGNIHYSPNGNIYGYHWYLKSVIKEWDAIVEGDYQSVMPIPRRPLTTFEQSLLPYLGPYTVNGYSAQRAQTFYEKWKQYRKDGYYGFNARFGKLIDREESTLIVKNHHYINLQPSYDQITEKYSSRAHLLLNEATRQTFVYGSDIKPETLIENENLNESEKSTLYRIMYNAVQRSVGWSLKVENKSSGGVAKSFFISDKSGIYEIFSSSQNDETNHLLMLDTLIRSNAGKPIRLYTHPSGEQINAFLGGESIEIMVAETSKTNFLTGIKSFFGLKSS